MVPCLAANIRIHWWRGKRVQTVTKSQSRHPAQCVRNPSSPFVSLKRSPQDFQIQCEHWIKKLIKHCVCTGIRVEKCVAASLLGGLVKPALCVRNPDHRVRAEIGDSDYDQDT